jgi:hypothetical protein
VEEDMYSIYQFGYKISEDAEEWKEQIIKLLGTDFKIDTVTTNYQNIEKNWHETILKSLNQLRNIELLEEKVDSVHASFNRYQSYVYLTLVFVGDITQKYDFIRKLQDRVRSNVVGFVDNFEIPFKEAESEEERAKYNEVLTLENPVLVTDEFHDSKYTLEKVKSGNLLYNYGYRSQGKNQYIREFKQVYISDTVSKEIIDHFHSIFVLFHRSHEFYKELSIMDNTRLILYEMSDAFNRIWPNERMGLFMLRRIWHTHLYNKTFFSVLELTAQMDTLINQLVVKNQKLYDKFDKQYERVLHNFDIPGLENCKIYDELLKYLKAPYNYRKHSIDNIRSLYEPTDAQICRLRSDNDSRVNFAIQSIMSILTVVFFLWGVLSVWYQTTIEYTAMASDKVLFNSYYFPATFSIIAFGTALCSVLIAIIVGSRNSNSYTKEIINVVESHNLDWNFINSRINKIKECVYKKNRLYLITELFSVFTAFLTTNSDSALLENYKEEMLRTIKEVDNCINN